MGLTQGAAPEVSAQWPMLPVGLFRSSLLLWQIGQALYSADVVNLSLASMIHVHPLAVSAVAAAFGGGQATRERPLHTAHTHRLTVALLPSVLPTTR